MQGSMNGMITMISHQSDSFPRQNIASISLQNPQLIWKGGLSMNFIIVPGVPLLFLIYSQNRCSGKF